MRVATDRCVYIETNGRVQRWWIEDQARNRVAWLAEGRREIAVGRAKGEKEEGEDGVKANVPLGSERCSNCENRRGTGGADERRSGTEGECPRGQPVRGSWPPID